MIGEAKRKNDGQVIPPFEKRAKVSNGVKPEEVGISEYIYKGGRITGVLKERYTDFMVNEIGMDGNVMHLVDLGFKLPEHKHQPKEESTKPEEDHQSKDLSQIVSYDDRKELEELLGEEDVLKVVAMTGGSKPFETCKTFDDKTERTKVHQLIRKAFQGILGTSTREDHIVIGVDSFRNNHTRPTKSARFEHNLGPRKGYLLFNLYKENKETMEVASIISKVLRVPSRYVKYAGTKDRRGVTVQRASISAPIERVNPLNKVLNGCKIGSFEYSDTPVSLGGLQGNEFLITIKDAEPVDPTVGLEETIKPIMESLGTVGFINYYGMQRFGTFSVTTNQVGKAILNSDWKTAGELILSEQEVVIPSSVQARHIWKQTRDPKLALKKMPRKCNAEYSILSRLDRAEKDEDGEYSANSYFNAIMGIPRNLRIMYGHAYQSYVWNVVATRRIQLFGLNVVAGDLVLEETQIDDSKGTEDVKQKSVVGARGVTKEEVAANKFSIHDIVLPTPGFDIVYPENEELRQEYVKVMAKDGLDPFDMARKVREFSLTGSYRNVVSKANSVEYHIRKYNDNKDELVRTDYEILKEGGDRILPGDPEGAKTAVIIKMQLAPSTYATMALRELIQ